MALQVALGAESGSSHEWVSGVLPVIVTDYVYSGARSWRLIDTVDASGPAGPTNSYVYRCFAARQVGWAFASPAALMRVCSFNRILGYRLIGSTYYLCYMNSSWTVLATGITAISAATWHFIEFEFNNNQITVWMDGTQEFTYTDSGQSDFASGNLFGANAAGKGTAADWRIDDIVSLDGLGSYWNARPNFQPRISGPALPTADDPSYSYNFWNLLDDVPPGGDTHNQKYVAVQQDSASIVAGGDIVQAVVQYGYESIPTDHRFAKEGGVEYQPSAEGSSDPNAYIGDGFAMSSARWSHRPDGTAWTQAAFDAVNFGICYTGTANIDQSLASIIYGGASQQWPPVTAAAWTPRVVII